MNAYMEMQHYCCFKRGNLQFSINKLLNLLIYIFNWGYLCSQMGSMCAPARGDPANVQNPKQSVAYYSLTTSFCILNTIQCIIYLENFEGCGYVLTVCRLFKSDLYRYYKRFQFFNILMIIFCLIRLCQCISIVLGSSICSSQLIILITLIE